MKCISVIDAFIPECSSVKLRIKYLIIYYIHIYEDDDDDDDDDDNNYNNNDDDDDDDEVNVVSGRMNI